MGQACFLHLRRARRGSPALTLDRGGLVAAVLGTVVVGPLWAAAQVWWCRSGAGGTPSYLLLENHEVGTKALAPILLGFGGRVGIYVAQL